MLGYVIFNVNNLHTINKNIKVILFSLYIKQILFMHIYLFFSDNVIT